MRRVVIAVAALFAVGIGVGVLTGSETATEKDWAIKASIIEACSCPMFCQCYFNSSPAGHGGHGGGDKDHFCKFNNAFRISQGHHGKTDLGGVLFWVAGDLGDDFSDGVMNWAVLIFDPKVSEAQRAAVAEILGSVYPVEWTSFEIGADAEMKWELSATRAEASLAAGDVAHVILNRMANHAQNPVIKGLNYWGLPHHEGFVLMPNEIEAYRVGDKAFEFGGGNGFTLTFALSSKDVAS